MLGQMWRLLSEEEKEVRFDNYKLQISKIKELRRNRLSVNRFMTLTIFSVGLSKTILGAERSLFY